MGFIFILQDAGHNDVSGLTSLNGNILRATGLREYMKNMHNDAIYKVRVDYATHNEFLLTTPNATI